MTEEVLKKLDDIIEVATSPGNVDYNEYMWGIANGLILARSIFTGIEPKYIYEPKEFLEDKQNNINPFEDKNDNTSGS